MVTLGVELGPTPRVSFFLPERLPFRAMLRSVFCPTISLCRRPLTFYPIHRQIATRKMATEAAAGTHKDPVTGEMISKTCVERTLDARADRDGQ